MLGDVQPLKRQSRSTRFTKQNATFPLAFCFSMVSLSWLWVCANSRSWQEHCWGPHPHWHDVILLMGTRSVSIFLGMFCSSFRWSPGTDYLGWPWLTIPLQPETSTSGGSKYYPSFQKVDLPTATCLLLHAGHGPKWPRFIIIIIIIIISISIIIIIIIIIIINNFWGTPFCLILGSPVSQCFCLLHDESAGDIWSYRSPGTWWTCPASCTGALLTAGCWDAEPITKELLEGAGQLDVLNSMIVSDHRKISSFSSGQVGKAWSKARPRVKLCSCGGKVTLSRLWLK